MNTTTEEEKSSEPKVWVFQANPKYFDIARAVEDGGVIIDWPVNQGKNLIKKGDKVYVWSSGPNSGIIAFGTVLCDPQTVPPRLDDPYLIDKSFIEKSDLWVDVSTDRRFNCISRAVLQADERTNSLKILRDFRKTNYPVTKEEEQGIESIIKEGGYELWARYSEADFLREVYIDETPYAELKELLLRKKNVILQGPPGVGKTYTAQRLAFSMMGEKDTSRVKLVQFHQNYSYEDFVMGYRPNENGGFTCAKGPFYEFCEEAKADRQRPYFFIIDEINRGNLSKIFGELLMLIESDKRGEEYSCRLIYSDEQFFVPENVYIIGMMNTADRSLAMIDYALRRRFAFFDMEPAFESDGFTKYQAAQHNEVFDALIEKVESLNTAIAVDSSLGRDFRIGHSYFCTNDTVDKAWMSSVIKYEVVPLLDEYWFDSKSEVDKWTKQLEGVVND